MTGDSKNSQWVPSGPELKRSQNITAVPIQNKNADTICDAYRDHIYYTFEGSSRILTDSRSELKNKEMQQVYETLGVKHIFSPVYIPESNGCLEGWHRFFKACITKHIHGGGVEWDELVPLAVSVYNFFPCQSSKESPFVLMFGRDPITPVAKMLDPKPRYYGEKGNALKMDMLRRLYTIVIDNIHKEREKKPKRTKLKSHSFKVNDMVLIKDPNSAVFKPKYQPNYRVTAIFGDNRIEVQDEKGHKLVRRSSHIKYVEPSEKVVQQLPSKELFQNYGRSSKLLIAAKDIPNLQFNMEKTEDISKFQEHSKNSPEGVREVMKVMETDVLSQTVSGECTDNLQISGDREHSRNLLSSVAGTALQRKNTEKMREITSDTNWQEMISKNFEHSRNSLSSAAGVTLQLVSTGEVTRRAFNMSQPERPNEYSKCSRKSWGSKLGVAVGPTDEVTAVVVNEDLQVKVSRNSKDANPV